MTHGIRLLAFLCASSVALAAAAVGPELPPFGFGDFDRSEPISITADQLEAQDTKGRRTLAFRRNVKVRQGPLALSANVLSALYLAGESQPSRLEARGAVRIREGARRARCDSALYERKAERIVCRGKPAELWDGDDYLAGREIAFDLARRSVAVVGGTELEIHRDLSEAGIDELGEAEGEEVRERLRDGGPVTIRATGLEASDAQDARQIRFLGDVVLQQGDIELHAGELLALYPPGAKRPERLIATHDVVLTEGAREARCQRAVYTLALNHIACEGEAVLRDGEDRLEGDLIAFDFEARLVDAEGHTRLRVRPRPRSERAR